MAIRRHIKTTDIFRSTNICYRPNNPLCNQFIKEALQCAATFIGSVRWLLESLWRHASCYAVGSACYLLPKTTCRGSRKAKSAPFLLGLCLMHELHQLHSSMHAAYSPNWRINGNQRFKSNLVRYCKQRGGGGGVFCILC